MAVYSQNMLWEGKGTVIIRFIVDGNILYEINNWIFVTQQMSSQSLKVVKKIN
jgi:hypothetical protein